MCERRQQEVISPSCSYPERIFCKMEHRPVFLRDGCCMHFLDPAQLRVLQESPSVSKHVLRAYRWHDYHPDIRDCGLLVLVMLLLKIHPGILALVTTKRLL